MIQPHPNESVFKVPHNKWVAALLRVDEQEVIDVAERLAEQHQVRLQRVPKAGLAMMRLRDSVQGQAFNLGEIPLSQAHVQVSDVQGNAHEGAAQIMRDHEALAVAMAVCDAILAARLDGWREAYALVERGTQAIESESRVRRTMLERSRVSFSLMNQDPSPPTSESEDRDDHA